jgi:hypothetical protein
MINSPAGMYISSILSKGEIRMLPTPAVAEGLIVAVAVKVVVGAGVLVGIGVYVGVAVGIGV